MKPIYDESLNELNQVLSEVNIWDSSGTPTITPETTSGDPVDQIRSNYSSDGAEGNFSNGGIASIGGHEAETEDTGLVPAAKEIVSSTDTINTVPVNTKPFRAQPEADTGEEDFSIPNNKEGNASGGSASYQNPALNVGESSIDSLLNKLEEILITSPVGPQSPNSELDNKALDYADNSDLDNQYQWDTVMAAQSPKENNTTNVVSGANSPMVKTTGYSEPKVLVGMTNSDNSNTNPYNGTTDRVYDYPEEDTEIDYSGSQELKDSYMRLKKVLGESESNDFDPFKRKILHPDANFHELCSKINELLKRIKDSKESGKMPSNKLYKELDKLSHQLLPYWPDNMNLKDLTCYRESKKIYSEDLEKLNSLLEGSLGTTTCQISNPAPAIVGGFSKDDDKEFNEPKNKVEPIGVVGEITDYPPNQDRDEDHNPLSKLESLLNNIN